MDCILGTWSVYLCTYYEEHADTYTCIHTHTHTHTHTDTWIVVIGTSGVCLCVCALRERVVSVKMQVSVRRISYWSGCYVSGTCLYEYVLVSCAYGTRCCAFDIYVFIE